MDTTASSRPDFRDHNTNSNNNNPANNNTNSDTQHYSHSTPFSQPLAPSSTLQPYLPSTRQQPLPQSLLPSPPLPHNSHDQSRQTAAPLPTPSSSLTRTPFSSSHPQSTLYQPQFKPLPSQSDPSYPDSQRKSSHHRDALRRSHPLSSSLPISRQSTQLHDERPYASHPSSTTFPSPTPPITSLDKRPQPFPHSRSLPYPLGHPSQPSTNPTSTAQTTATATGPTPTPPSSTHQPPPATASPSRPSSSPVHQQEQGPLYDIAKLLAAHCTILSGKVYNDKGHNICGVLNQHDKPCKRIGKCPFHGVHKPVTAHNSVNGTIDASGTVPTPSTSPDGTHSPPGQSGAAYDNRSSGGSDSTAVNGSRPRIPPKQQYKHGWSKEEHFLFLGGLSQHGKGSWKQIASVVKTRTPTQVQSHAQKYFQRQKQSDKNKRSIHDLSLDSPEMIEVAKKFKAGGQRIGLPGGGMGEPLPISAIADGGALRTHGVTMAPSALSLSHNPLQADSLGRGLLNDSGLARFGSNAQNSLVSKFGPGQATSATTLGSSLSSGVQIPQIPGTAAHRSFPLPNTNVGQPELFGHINQGTINSSQRRTGDTRLPLKMEATPGRDVILNSVRPAFMPDTYQGNTSGQLIPGQHLLGTRQSLYANQQKATGGLPGNETGATAEHGTAQTAYQANALQGLYPQMASNSTVFPQTRAGNETQLQWTYDSEGKARRPRELNGTNRDAFHLQSAHLSSSLQGIGAIPISEHLTGATGIGNEHQVDQPFDGTQQNQGSAFANGIFGGGHESVEVDTNVYGVGAGQPGHVSVASRLSTGVSGYPHTTGVPMGQVHLQTHFGGGPGSYHRSD